MSDASTLLNQYRTMSRIRSFEQTARRLGTQGKLAGTLHLSIGQEASAVGACSQLTSADLITTTHRGHGHCLAKGAEPKRMFAELMGRACGYGKGRSGSMHLADPETGNLGANAIVGAGIPIALGAALAIRVDGATRVDCAARVAVAFFGEGATAQGVLFETLNLASLWKLPLIFVCENNHYVELSPASEVLSARSLADLGRPFGVVGVEVDGNDVEAVSEAMLTAVARARAGDGPTFLELDTYRQAGHYEGDQMRYRTVEEAQAWALRDPLLLCETRLRELNVDDAVVATIREESTAEMEAAVDWSSQQPAAEATSLLEDVYAELTNSQSTAISSADRGATSGAER